MSTSSQAQPHASSPRPLQLRNRHRAELSNFLLQRIDANLFPYSWLENHGVQPNRISHFNFWAYLGEERTIQSVALNIADRLLMLDTAHAEDARSFGVFFRRQPYRFHHIVSPTKSVVPFWKDYADPLLPNAPVARLIQDQLLYKLTPAQFQRPQRPLSKLRPARPSELDPIFLASVQMHREETGEDPLQKDPETFRRHVRHRLTMGRTFAWFDEHRHLLFKADISIHCSLGAQISGVYTSPHHRNKGIATKALFDLCALHFDQDLPRLTLYVNETNKPALKVYHRLGFELSSPYQTIFLAN